MPKSFDELCNQYGCDKGTEVRWKHGYSAVYEKLFSPLRDQAITLLEIGILDPAEPGASLKVFYDYFPAAKIVGFDILDASAFENDRVATFRGDQTKRTDLISCGFQHGPFDVIIDDGCHTDTSQQTSLACLFKYLKSGGLYIIEDLHVAPFTIEVLARFSELGKIDTGYFEEEEREVFLDSVADFKFECNSKMAVFKKK